VASKVRCTGSRTLGPRGLRIGALSRPALRFEDRPLFLSSMRAPQRWPCMMPCARLEASLEIEKGVPYDSRAQYLAG